MVSLSLVSLFDIILNNGLGAIFADILVYYRELTYIAIEVPLSVFNLKIDQWYSDTIFASAIVQGVFVRSYLNSGGILSAMDAPPMIAAVFVYFGFIVLLASGARSIYFAWTGNREGLADERTFVSITVTSGIVMTVILIMQFTGVVP